MKKILIALVAILTGATIIYFVVNQGKGPKQTDTAKGVVKSPPPEKKHSSHGCISPKGIVVIIEASNPNDVGHELEIDSIDVDVCKDDTVCMHVVGPSHARRVKIKSQCKPKNCNCP
jgi:hypothetical protein